MRHESPPITTTPGLPPFILYVKVSFKQQSFEATHLTKSGLNATQLSVQLFTASLNSYLISLLTIVSQRSGLSDLFRTLKIASSRYENLEEGDISGGIFIRIP